jgi:uncharacterized membrane protein YkoI
MDGKHHSRKETKLMKRKLIVTLSLCLILMLAGLPAMAETSTTPTTVASFAMPAISFDQAVILARAAAPGYELMALSLEDENGTQIYQAELINPIDVTMVEVMIDASSGQTIINNAAGENAMENSNETADEQNGNDSNVEYVGSDDGQDQGENEAADVQNGKTATDTTDTTLMAKDITLTQAKETILSAYAGAVIIDIQLEDENGMPVYSATLKDANGHQIEVMVDAVSGTILPGENQSTDN